MSVLDQERPAGLVARLEAAGFEGVDIVTDEQYGDRRKLVIWVDDR